MGTSDRWGISITTSCKFSGEGFMCESTYKVGLGKPDINWDKFQQNEIIQIVTQSGIRWAPSFPLKSSAGSRGGHRSSFASKTALLVYKWPQVSIWWWQLAWEGYVAVSLQTNTICVLSRLIFIPSLPRTLLWLPQMSSLPNLHLRGFASSLVFL